jgi:hypothetical protein
MLLFTLKHILLSLSGYYFLLLLLDWISLGMVSRSLPLGAIPVLIVVLGFLFIKLSPADKNPPPLLSNHFLFLAIPPAILGGLFFYSRDFWSAILIASSFLFIVVLKKFFKNNSLDF